MHMKYLVAASLPLSLVSGWTIQLGQDVWTGTWNKGCTRTSHRTGEKLSWARAFGSSCCIHLYRNTVCKDPMAGISCPNWSKNLGQDIGSFSVTNCIFGFKVKADKRAVEAGAEEAEAETEGRLAETDPAEANAQSI
jgi:hypothetical protein